MDLQIGFTVEMFIRIIAMGFWDRSADVDSRVDRYLNDDWNKLDFFVVLSSWLNVLVEVTGIELGVEMKTLRALRVLRVLKAFKNIKGIRQILGTIGQAIPYSLNVMAFLGFLFLVMGIIGVQMFRGLGRSRCEVSAFDLQALLNEDKFPLADTGTLTATVPWDGNRTWSDGASHPVDMWGGNRSWEPVEEMDGYEYPIGIGIWITYCTVDSDCPLYDVPGQYNRTQRCVPAGHNMPGKTFQSYDNIIEAWIAMFINMANLYWWETAHRLADANNGLGSVIAWHYGALNVFLLTYVTVNMFVAVITTVFMDVRTATVAEATGDRAAKTAVEKRDEAEAARAALGEKWSKPFYFIAFCGGEGPFAEPLKAPEDRQGYINFAIFDQGILGMIFLNTALLASDHHSRGACPLPRDFVPSDPCQSDDYITFNMYANYVFNFIFFVECVSKIFGMGFREYIRPHFNKLDFFIVVTSSLDMLGEALATEGEDSGMGVFKLFRIFRLFRVLRVARILYKNKNLKRVLTTVFGSGDALANLLLFIIFAVMLFAIGGMHLISGQYKPENGYGDNSGNLWGRVVGDGVYDIKGYLASDDDEGGACTSGECSFQEVEAAVAARAFQEDAMELHYGYDVTDFIRQGLIPRRSFEDFPRAFLMAFQVMTGDDWVNQMHDNMETAPGLITPLLFFANFAFCNFILLSLFIAVILENFEIAEKEKKELQKEKMKGDMETAKLESEKPKVSFVHRLVWLCGGEGKEPGSLCGMAEDTVLDVDGVYGPREKVKNEETDEIEEVPVEFGTIMPGDKWYNDNKSIFSLGPESGLRKSAKALSENKIFDLLVLIAILLGTVLLALEGPPGSLDPDLAVIYDNINHVLFAIFMVEFLSKTIGNGFMFTPESYLKNHWNKIDFVVIVGSIINYLGGNAGFVRLLRCLRPLRIINRVEGMRIIISAVVNSLAVNIGVLALSGLGLLMFGILGCALFGGKMWSCNCSHSYPEGLTPENTLFTDDGGWIDIATGERCSVGNSSGTDPFAAPDGIGCRPQFVDTEQQCVGEYGNVTMYGIDPSFGNAISQCYWDNRPYNFDTTGNAMMSLFTASTLAGWTDIMEVAVDSRGIGLQPIPFSGAWGWKTAYFLAYVIIMAFFVTQLFIGVLIDFIGNSDGTALLTEEQQQLIDLQKFQKLHRPALREKAPPNCLRAWFYGIVESNFWERLSNGFIVFNVVVMMCESEDMTQQFSDWQDDMNTICLYFFTIEMFMKMIAYFPRKAFSDGWYCFDVAVVGLSWAAILFQVSGAKAIRAMRALRIILVLKSAKGIRSLFQTLILSIFPAINISVLVLLLYSLYAILGMMLFGNMPIQDLECATSPTDMSNEHCTYTWDTLGPDVDYTDKFAGIARGQPGQMLMGLNRQYTKHSNFRDFTSALRLLFQCAAGQDWKFIMYAVGGEPCGYDCKDDQSFPSTQGLAFVYFCSFFFLSNYILLNLFVAVILDNFSASMREQELDISEADFEAFKYTFRDHTTDKTPEVLQFEKLWQCMAAIGQLDGEPQASSLPSSVRLTCRFARRALG